nr:bifunctional diaminohydroxyphosphoribosylaminopyrimidine deaminase/5-amino-6-(5-phosphoribosylamino)uracil reductase RibD [Pasteuria penetrans]
MKSPEEWMKLALELAYETHTSPNPRVGAVVVREGALVGCGAHVCAGSPHAEVQALRMAGEAAEGATLYVTLEPCVHYGRTPPCVEAIVASGIREVRIGCLDPDERVRGRGVEFLRAAGIYVVPGVVEEDCMALNEGYLHHRETGRPLVILKVASTLDGRLATVTGDSLYITGKVARARVHELRHRCDAVLTGIGTVLADDPQLTVRLPAGGHQPMRVIVDSQLRLPPKARLVREKGSSTWVFTTEEGADPDRRALLEGKGVRVSIAGKGPRTCWGEVLRQLGTAGITSLLVEAGGTVNASLLHAGVVQKVVWFLAPKLLGGINSLPSIAGGDPLFLSEALPLHDVQVERLGEDLCLSGSIR